MSYKYSIDLISSKLFFGAKEIIEKECNGMIFMFCSEIPKDEYEISENRLITLEYINKNYDTKEKKLIIEKLKILKNDHEFIHILKGIEFYIHLIANSIREEKIMNKEKVNAPTNILKDKDLNLIVERLYHSYDEDGYSSSSFIDRALNRRDIINKIRKEFDKENIKVIKDRLFNLNKHMGASLAWANDYIDIKKCCNILQSDFILNLNALDISKLSEAIINGYYNAKLNDEELYIEKYYECSWEKREYNRNILIDSILNKIEKNNLLKLIKLLKEHSNKAVTDRTHILSCIEKLSVKNFIDIDFNKISEYFYDEAAKLGWHETKPDFPSFCMNMHSEIDEMWEAYRENRLDKPCDKENKMKEQGLEVLTAFEEEMADIVIRAFDTAKAFNVNLNKAIKSKALYNRSRGYKHGGKKC